MRCAGRVLESEKRQSYVVFSLTPVTHDTHLHICLHIHSRKHTARAYPYAHFHTHIYTLVQFPLIHMLTLSYLHTAFKDAIKHCFLLHFDSYVRRAEAEMKVCFCLCVFIFICACVCGAEVSAWCKSGTNISHYILFTHTHTLPYNHRTCPETCQWRRI